MNFENRKKIVLDETSKIFEKYRSKGLISQEIYRSLEQDVYYDYLLELRLSQGIYSPVENAYETYLLELPQRLIDFGLLEIDAGSIAILTKNLVETYLSETTSFDVTVFKGKLYRELSSLVEGEKFDLRKHMEATK
tara:strand:- start:1358 stop:1765 length:408 start_codon:yes stop_codon:yes gene_type:complete